MHVVALIQKCLVEPPQGGTDSPEPCCFLQESLFLAEDKRTYIQGFDLHLGCKISAADGTVIRVTWLCCIVIACTPCQFLAADGLYRLQYPRNTDIAPSRVAAPSVQAALQQHDSFFTHPLSCQCKLWNGRLAQVRKVPELHRVEKTLILRAGIAVLQVTPDHRIALPTGDTATRLLLQALSGLQRSSG